MAKIAIPAGRHSEMPRLSGSGTRLMIEPERKMRKGAGNEQRESRRRRAGESAAAGELRPVPARTSGRSGADAGGRGLHPVVLRGRMLCAVAAQTGVGPRRLTSQAHTPTQNVKPRPWLREHQLFGRTGHGCRYLNKDISCTLAHPDSRGPGPWLSAIRPLTPGMRRFADRLAGSALRT